jgi:hypothetical protein
LIYSEQLCRNFDIEFDPSESRLQEPSNECSWASNNIWSRKLQLKQFSATWFSELIVC